MDKHDDEKLNKWRLLFEEKEKSNLTIKEFCSLKNITQSAFYHFKNRINGRYTTQQKSRVIKNNKLKNLAEIKLTNQTVSHENSNIRLILPNSLQCILPRDLPITQMKAIVELLLSC